MADINELKNTFSFLDVCSITTESFLSLAIAIAVPTLLGRLAGSHVRNFKQIYHNLTIKPNGIPSNFIFRPIWTTLYISMGLASFLVYQTGTFNNVSIIDALAFYSFQLLFNLCWPALFFRYRNYKVSLYIITVNLIAAIITTSKFYKVNQLAGNLMIPYLVWLTISGYINKKIWRLNQDNLKVLVGKKSNYKRYNSNPVELPKQLCIRCNKVEI